MLLPWLEVKLRESFPDPAQFKEEKEFTYAALSASVFKKVIAELIGWVAQQKTVKKDLLDKKEGKVKNFRLGGE